MRASTNPAAAVSRSSAATASSLHGRAYGPAGSTPASAPTRAASRSRRSTLASIAASLTRPSRTASSSASPQGPCGPGMARSSAALPAASVLRAAVQSDMTSPSQPHSSWRISWSIGDSVIVGPLTAL